MIGCRSVDIALGTTITQLAGETERDFSCLHSVTRYIKRCVDSLSTGLMLCGNACSLIVVANQHRLATTHVLSFAMNPHTMS